jgi:peptide/nickel transport system substrate-binding protein
MATAPMPVRLRFGRCATVILALVLSGCAAPGGQVGSGGTGEPQPAQAKILNIAITTNPAAVTGDNAPTTGGYAGVDEVHSQGLITTDLNQVFIGRLAERVPSLDDGSVSLLPDGRMRVLFSLHKGVTWHDGAPFTAHDLVFTHKAMTDRMLGIGGTVEAALASVEASDDHSAVFIYRSPYYLGHALQLRAFWPRPRHILEPIYEGAVGTNSPDGWIHAPYWTTEYVHLGPFRLASWDPGTNMQFTSYDGYFLGRPKLDVVNVRILGNENAAMSELLAGTIDLFSDGAMGEELGEELRARWQQNGGGAVYLRPGVTRNLFPQVRAEYQREPANLDPRVRTALYHAIDRDALAGGRGGNSLGAWSLLPPGDPLYDATKDALRRFSYDPERARTLLRDLGWAPGPDRILQNSVDGRKFRTQISNTSGQAIESQVVGDYWRQIGLEIEEIVIPAALSSDREYRATYPGWEGSSGGYGDQISRFTGPAATAPRWSGNRGGYDDPTANALYARYTSSVSERDQFQAMRAINDFFVENIPNLPLYYATDFLGHRSGVVAPGLAQGSGPPSASRAGSPARNAYLWDLD